MMQLISLYEARGYNGREHKSTIPFYTGPECVKKKKSWVLSQNTHTCHAALSEQSLRLELVARNAEMLWWSQCCPLGDYARRPNDRIRQKQMDNMHMRRHVSADT